MPTILIADESRNHAGSLRSVLLAAGHRVAVVHAPGRVHELARALQPDLILLDEFPAEISGLDVLTALKRDALTAHVPVVMMAMRPQAATKIRALWRGASDLLPKPVNANDMLAIVRALAGPRVQEIREAG